VNLKARIMSRLEIVVTLVLILSLIANVGFFIYTRSILSRLLFMSEELGDLQDMINNFSNHITNVYNLEMFYGDQTLGALMEHAVSLNEQLETFEFIYSLTTNEEINKETNINEPSRTNEVEEDYDEEEETG
jgi:PDZ domain-containing secreted protein